MNEIKHNLAFHRNLQVVYIKRMKKQKFVGTVAKKTSSVLNSNLNKALDERRKLQIKLREATNKQHQDMSRAIELKEKNIILRNQLHDARLQACQLKNWF